MRLIPLFACALASLSSCRTSNPAASTEAVDSGLMNLGTISCGADESVILYSLVGTDPAPVGLTTLKGNLTFKPGQDTYLSGIRFDMCSDFSGENLTLKRIVRPTSTFGLGRLIYTAFVPDTIQPDPGLRKAIAEQDYQALHIEVRNQDQPQYSVLVQGWKTPDGKGFATISRFDPATGDPLTASDDPVDYGELVAGDSLNKRLKNNDRLLTAPNLKLELRYEITGNPGMYVAVYRKNDFCPLPSSTLQ